jgi:hypothetical protein
LSASHALSIDVSWETRAIFILTKCLFLLATPANSFSSSAMRRATSLGGVDFLYAP